MMPFLKSILSRNNDKSTIADLEEELSRSNKRIAELEDRVENLANCVHELSQCVTQVAEGSAALTNDMLCISEILKQASSEIQKNEKDIFRWRPDDDSDGYLN